MELFACDKNIPEMEAFKYNMDYFSLDIGSKEMFFFNLSI